MQNKKGFFKSVWEAITNFESYKEFAYQSGPKVIKYAVILLVLFSLIVTVAVSIPAIRTINSGTEYFENEFPDLIYENGKLSVKSEQPIYLESEESLDSVLLIDTNASLEKQEEYLEEQKQHKTSILLFDDKLIIKTTGLTAYTTYEYTQIQDNFNFDKLTKQDIVDKFTGANIYKIYASIYLFLFAYMLLTYIVIIFIDVVILSILALLISKLYKVKLKYSNCIKLSVYALTLPLILQLIYVYINAFTGFTIQYFAVMYDVISYIYVITAIIIMKNDLAKQDIGLIEEVKIKPEDNEAITNEEVERQKDEKKKREKKKEKVNPDVEPGKA